MIEIRQDFFEHVTIQVLQEETHGTSAVALLFFLALNNGTQKPITSRDIDSNLAFKNVRKHVKDAAIGLLFTHGLLSLGPEGLYLNIEQVQDVLVIGR